MAVPELNVSSSPAASRFPFDGLSEADTLTQDWSQRATLRPRSQHIGSGVEPNLSPAGVVMDVARPQDSQWCLMHVIGEGGMGQVYAAKQRSLARTVALKLPHPHRRTDQDQSFIAEALVTAALEHPGIVPVYDLGCSSDQRPFYAMRLINGRPWSESIGMDLDRDIEILIAICQTIAYAHHRGVLHRDLKPENVLLGVFGEVLLCDWGIAVSFRANGIAQHPTLHPVGTPIYVPPEMADPTLHEQGPHTDVYLLGALLWHIITGDGPHPGNNGKECMASARINAIIPPAWEDGRAPHPGAAMVLLASIARTAMATNPAHRHESAQAFLAALRTWQHTRTSREALDRAQRALQRADQYQAFQHVLYGCAEAARLWKDNPDVPAVRQRALRGLSELALMRGDLDLAASTIAELTDAREALSAQLAAARQQRDREQLAGQRLAEVEERVHRDASRQWRTVLDIDFTTTDEATIRSLFDIRGRWRVDRDGLHVQGGQPSLIVLRQSVPGDVRLVFSAEQPGPCDDLGCLLNATLFDLDHRDFSHSMIGYEFRHGWQSNQRDIISSRGRTLFERACSPIRAGQPTLISAQRIGNTLVWMVAGEETVTVVDEQPLHGPHFCKVALSSYLFGTCFRYCRIESLGVARRSDLLDLIERHLEFGHAETASHLLDDVELASLDADRRARLEALRQRVHEACAKQHSERTVRQALLRLVVPAAAARVQSDQNRILVDIAGAQLVDWPGLSQLPVSGLTLRSLAQAIPLAALSSLPLSSLSISHTALADHGHLAEMPLQRLAVRCAQVDRIERLPTTLTALDLHGNPLADISAVRGLSLTELDLGDTAVRDLSALEGMPVATLLLSKTRIADLSVLDRLPLTNKLALRDTACRDVSMLAGRTINRLLLADNQLRDIAPLRGVAHGRLDLSRNSISDLAPFAGQLIMTLILAGNPITSLRAMRDAKVNALDLSSCPLDPCAELDALAAVVTGGLRLADCGMRSVGALSALRLASLDLADNHIEDASALAGCASLMLELGGNPLRSLGALVEQPPMRINVWHPALPLHELERALQHWRTLDQPALVEHIEAVIAVLSGDQQALRSQATVHSGGVRQLRLPIAVRREELAGVLAQTGAHLVPLRSLTVPWSSVPDCWVGNLHDEPCSMPSLINPNLLTQCERLYPLLEWTV